MKAEEFVGKWIVSNTVARVLNMPADTAFKVVGYNADRGWAIVDAGLNGCSWRVLKPSDVIVEQCETYWLVYLESITKVL